MLKQFKQLFFYVLEVKYFIVLKLDKYNDKQTDRQTDRQTDKQTQHKVDNDNKIKTKTDLYREENNLNRQKRNMQVKK